MKFGCISQRIRGDIGAKGKTAQPATSLSANAARTKVVIWMRGPPRPRPQHDQTRSSQALKPLSTNPAREAGRRRRLVVAKTTATRHTETPFAAD
jgi:hypothetical protein